MRYLGIDYGTKKVGLALSGEAGSMGFPHSILMNDSRLVDQVAKLVAEESIEAIVIGESRNLGGEDNAVAREARAFAESLEALTHVPVYWEPEMFTTQEARRDFEGVHNNKGVVDSSAAALILTSYLDRTQSSESAS
jgi:putative Holliday junction resolvase